MRSEVEPHSGARHSLFPPSLARFRPVAIVARFELDDFPKRALSEYLAQSEEIRIPSQRAFRDGFHYHPA